MEGELWKKDIHSSGGISQEKGWGKMKTLNIDT